jgi:hypothetical protein
MVSPKRALIKHKNYTPEKFDPKRFRLKQKALDFTLDEAKRIKDWPTLEEAVDAKLVELVKFVAWWNVAVRGAGQPKKNGNGSVTILSESQAKKLTGIGKMQKSRMATKLKDPANYRRELLGSAYLTAQLADPDHFRTQFTGNNEWHTPAEYIAMARAVLGEIDLDPASSDIAQRTVQAVEYFTFVSDEDSGLTKPWHGRVWLNPPYAPIAIAAFVAKLIDEYQSSRVSAAIVLTHNYTDSGWFQKLAPLAAAICFPGSRVRFVDQDGVPCSPTQGQAFFYLGGDRSKFVEQFSKIGFTVFVNKGVCDDTVQTELQEVPVRRLQSEAVRL